MSRRRAERTCASSEGGPGWKRGEQSGLRSTLGTETEDASEAVSSRERLKEDETSEPMKPSFGRVRSGAATSRVMPHTTEVFPRRTSVDEGAVETEPVEGGSGVS